MLITLHALGGSFDITKYVDKPVAETANIIGMFDSAVINIHLIRYDALEGIDMSKRVPLMAIVEIDDNQYFVTKSNVIKKNDDEYAHQLELVELAYILKLRPIPNVSTTQPVDAYKAPNVVEVSGVNQDTLFVDVGQTATKTASLETKAASNDVGVILEREIKTTGSFNLIGEFRLSNSWMGEGSVRIKANNTVIFSATSTDIFGQWAAMTEWVVAFNFDVNLTDGDIITAEYSGVNNVHFAAIDTYLDAQLSIYYNDTISTIPNKKYLDDVVKKALKLNNDEITLEANTEARLSNILAFEDIITDATLYDVIIKVARYVGAKPKVRYQDEGKELSFIFFDDLERKDWVDIIMPEEIASKDVNEYTSGLITKNNNIVKNNPIIETVTLRTTSGTSQITTDNIKIVLTYPIDRIESVFVAQSKLNGIDYFGTDITNRVVEKDYYYTLDDMANYTNRSLDNKNNHVWFERGSNIIDGLSYVGGQYQTWQATKSNRALYEAIACEEGVLTTIIDDGLEADNFIEIQVIYYEMSEVEAVVNKDDLSGFEERIYRKINANERVNNADLLGGYIRNKVNAIGNTQVAVQGYGEIPNLGTIKNDYRVVSVTSYKGAGSDMFLATLVKDHIFETEYIGIESDRRLYIVPKDNIVRRQDIRIFEINLRKNYVETDEPDFTFDYRYLLNNIGYSGYMPNTILKTAAITVDNVDLAIPLSVVPIGNTITFTAKLHDNFNAGYQKIKTLVNSNVIVYQRGVRYTDRFGYADIINVSLTTDMFTPKDDLPLRTDTPSYQSVALSETYLLNKDAREAMSYSAQFIGQSRDSDIIVYDGFAKYNTALGFDAKDIGFGKLGYRPNRDDRYVDITRISPLDYRSSVSISLGEIDINDSVDNYVWYNKHNSELILVLFNGNKIYFDVGRPVFQRGRFRKLISSYIWLNNLIEAGVVENVELVNNMAPLVFVNRSATEIFSEMGLLYLFLSGISGEVLNDALTYDANISSDMELGIKNIGHYDNSLEIDANILGEAVINDTLELNNYIMVTLSSGETHVYRDTTSLYLSNEIIGAATMNEHLSSNIGAAIDYYIGETVNYKEHVNVYLENNIVAEIVEHDYLRNSMKVQAWKVMAAIETIIGDFKLGLDNEIIGYNVEDTFLSNNIYAFALTAPSERVTAKYSLNLSSENEIMAEIVEHDYLYKNNLITALFSDIVNYSKNFDNELYLVSDIASYAVAAETLNYNFNINNTLNIAPRYTAYNTFNLSVDNNLESYEVTAETLSLRLNELVIFGDSIRYYERYDLELEIDNEIISGGVTLDVLTNYMTVKAVYDDSHVYLQTNTPSITAMRCMTVIFMGTHSTTVFATIKNNDVKPVLIYKNGVTEITNGVPIASGQSKELVVEQTYSYVGDFTLNIKAKNIDYLMSEATSRKHTSACEIITI